MTDFNNDISGFSGKDFKISEDGLDVDFSRAKLLNTTGSICDAFEYRQGTRRVFVKKLKARFQNSPRHRAALRKEYEIGASLSHPSLPVYRYAKNDYIVSDFIDGKTLSAMIQNRDPWLESGENVLKILRELTSVIGYLHDRNLVHSDIKADNVIITSGIHNAMLLDFDKCHSSALDMASGSPGLYGVKEDDTGNPQIDFNGLARIAEKLLPFVKSSGYKKLLGKFIKGCGSYGVTTDKLLDILRFRRRSAVTTVWLSAAMMVALGAAIMIVFFVDHHPEKVTVNNSGIISQNEGPDSTSSNLNHTIVDPVDLVGIVETPSHTGTNYEDKEDLNTLNHELEHLYYPLYAQIEMTLDYIKEQGGAEVLYGEEALQLLDNVNELQQEVWNKGFKLYWSLYPHLEYEKAYEGYTAMPAFPKMVHSVDTVNNMLVPVINKKAPELRNRTLNYDNI